MFKGRKRGAGAGAAQKRGRRDREEEEEGEEERPSVVKAEKKRRAINTFATEGVSKSRSAAVEEVMSGGRVESTREGVAVDYGGGATAYDETNTAADRDHRAILEKSIEMNEAGQAGDGIYRGQAGYVQHAKKQQSQVGGNKHTGTQGPIRAPQFVRSICVMDYQPDVCKDYKETGYCGFGDSCIYLHDRGDYKAGWQQEKDWEERLKKRKEREALGEWAVEGSGGEEEDNENVEGDKGADFPHACFICRDGFRDPVVTNCGHYFCQKCAVDHYRDSIKCAACGKPTGGVFNRAVKLIAAMKQAGQLKQTGPGVNKSNADAGLIPQDEEQEEAENYEVKDEVEVTVQSLSRQRQGGWSTVESS
jgi:RING finger protein 113A